MIALVLALTAAVPRNLLEAADSANMVHAQCLFTTIRAARQANVPIGEFERRLRSNCSAEAQRLRSASAKIFAARGEPNPSAKADRLIEDRYRSAVDQYRRLPEAEKQLRAIGELCKSDPRRCN